jgi:hypothetical protein
MTPKGWISRKATHLIVMVISHVSEKSSIEISNFFQHCQKVLFCGLMLRNHSTLLNTDFSSVEQSVSTVGTNMTDVTNWYDRRSFSSYRLTQVR